MTPAPLVAVDIGNSRTKFGFFREPCSGLPRPVSTCTLGRDESPERVQAWLHQQLDGAIDWAALRWEISSVRRPSEQQLLQWLGKLPLGPRQPRVLRAADLPLEVDLPLPEHAGTDRLLAAVTINRLRAPLMPAISVDLGTAITVNAVSAAGAFLGGAILPGLTTAAASLHEMTDLLPLIDLEQLRQPPAALGTGTPEAMTSGIFWGAVGAIRELVERYEAHLGSPAQIFLTGGQAGLIAGSLGRDATHVPHLTLVGIALTAWQRTD